MERLSVVSCFYSTCPFFLPFFAECDDFVLVDNIQRQEFVIFCGVLRYITVIIIINIIMFPSA